MSVCAGIKRDGGRCTAPALPGEEWCYGHHPGYADKRRRDASRSHKTRSGMPEIRSIKERLSDLAEGILEGRVDRGDAAVASQVLNVCLRAISMELKIKETEELEKRLEELEVVLKRQRQEGASRWG
jgi:hypothetical protein